VVRGLAAPYGGHHASQVLIPGVAADPARWLLGRVDGVPTAYGCLAETLYKAVVGQPDHWVGEIGLDQVSMAASWFAEAAWDHVPLMMFGQPLILDHLIGEPALAAVPDPKIDHG